MRIFDTYFNKYLTWLFFVILLVPLSSSAQDWIYTVSEGDNLWVFSEKHLDTVLRFEQLRKMNNIKNPKRMKPGSKIRVPLQWVRSNPVPAEIVAIHGSAQLFRVNGNVENISQNGTLIYLGDRIKINVDSSIAIKFADDSILTLYADSLIRFDHLSAHGVTGMVDSRLHLLEGRMDTRVTPIVGPGTRFEIHTPSAISAVRGTEYRTAVDTNNQTSNIEVLHGKVTVKGEQKQRLIQAGFGTQVQEGKDPIPPQQLLEPPLFNKIPDRIRILNWLFSWEPLPKASKYRVEISNETQFNTVIWDKTTKYPKIGLPDLLDGNYFIRVRAIDKFGLEGKQTVSKIVMDTRPQSPVQLKPKDGSVFRGKTPELLWTDSAEADKYHLEIATDKTFKKTVINLIDLDQTNFNTDELTKINQYFWRLTSISSDGEFGPVGPIRSYEIKPIPEKITADMTVADDGKLNASWQPGNSGQTYHVQMAYDEQFSDLEINTTQSESSLSFDPIQGQVRYLRIRSIEPDGYEGPWGAVQRIEPLPDKSFWMIPILTFIGILVL